MIYQETGHTEEPYFDEKPTLMDWCQDLFDDSTLKPADSPIPTQDKWKPKETSSYGKSSCVLPITFFDIQSNIQFLNLCNPLSIQVVDCDKHPWYYKKYTRSNTTGISAEDMGDTTKLSNKPYGKLAGVDVVKCIDLTENSFNSFKQNCDTVNNVTNLNKVVTYENKMSSITNTKKTKPHRVSKNITKDDLEKQKARSQVNFSKIDLKHNTGLVGLKIIPSLGFNIGSVIVEKKKHTKPLPSKTENIEVDECFSSASKTLSRFGTIIVPVNNQTQCKNIDKDYIPNKNTFEFKVPSQSSVQVTVSTPESNITNTLSKTKDDLCLVPNTNDINDNYKTCSKVKQYSSKKTNKQVQVKKSTETLESDIELLKQAVISCTSVNKGEPSCQVQENQNKCTTENTLRSKSPIFPCNSKQKMQSELEKQLVNGKSHVDQNINKKASKTPKCNDMEQNNMVFIGNWPNSAHKHKQTPPNTTKILRDNSNKNGNTVTGHLNKTQSVPTNSIKNITENNCRNTKNLHNNYNTLHTDNTVHTEPNKRVTPVVTPIINMPKSSNECKKTTALHLLTDQARGDDFNKNAKTVSAINSINNEILKKTSSNSNSMHSTTKTNVNSRNKNLECLYQKTFANINKSKLPPKVSDKHEKTSKTPPPKTGPLKKTDATNISLLKQNHVSSRSEPTETYSGRVSSVVTSQNFGVNLAKQQTGVSNRPESNTEYPGRTPNVTTTQNVSASLLKQPMPGTLPAYCKVNGISNNFARHPNFSGIYSNVYAINVENAKTEWDPRLHFPIPPFMHPPPLFLPPPPLPPSLERFHSIINSLQNLANNPIDEVRYNDPNNLKADLMANTKITKNSNNSMGTKNIVDQPTLQYNHQDISHPEKTKRVEQIIETPSYKLNISPAANKTDSLQIQQIKSSDNTYKKKLPEKANTSHNPNKIPILRDITITAVAKVAKNSTQYNSTSIPENNLNPSMKQNGKTFDEKKKYDRNSSLHSGNSKDLQINKNEMKPKPGPLCMKNRTGPFAVKNAAPPARGKLPTLTVNSKSKPNKGYSPPILPIPTFQSLLSQTHDLEVSMLDTQKTTNPYPCLSSFTHYTSAQNSIPNSNPGDKGSRKRLHFDEKDVNEAKKVKKISLDDYLSRCPSLDNSDGLINDPAGMLGRKYPRKSEKSCKSAKSLADVVNKNLDREL